MKPLLYDLYCGGGGATCGYQRAGFRVIGIDLHPQRHYIGDGFIQMDALEFMRRYLAGEYAASSGIRSQPAMPGIQQDASSAVAERMGVSVTD